MTRVFSAHRSRSVQPRPAAAERPAAADSAPAEPAAESAKAAPQKAKQPDAEKPKEIGGPSGPEPTRYGDWERKGICVDF